MNKLALLKTDYQINQIQINKKYTKSFAKEEEK